MSNIEMPVRSPALYTIGQVAKLTGLSSHNIRTWEGRYSAISPQRTPGGLRRYGSDQVARLTLLKELVDSGESIGGVAGQSDTELKALCAARMQPQLPAAAAVRPIGVIGESLPTILKQHGALMPGLEFHPLSLAQHQPDVATEAMLIEKATLDEDIFAEVADLRDRFAVDVVVVLYGYATQALAVRVSSDTTACLRMPINYRELQRTLHALLPPPGEPRPSSEVMPHRYSKDVLARVASMAPAIACECPRHVAEILFALTDFETYSANCEDKHPLDAAVHNYLRTTASHARIAFEQALATVAAHEQIPLEDWRTESALPR